MLHKGWSQKYLYPKIHMTDLNCRPDIAEMANEWFYLLLKSITPAERTTKEVDGILKLCELNKIMPPDKSNFKILDSCCGYGRHAIELSARGFQCIAGIDLSPTLISKAKKIEKTCNTKAYPEFTAGNIVKMPYDNSYFDLVLNLWTSFGLYSEEDNKRCLKEINRVLRKKGFIFFDLHNLYHFFISGRLGNHYYKEGSLLYLEDVSYEPLTGREETKAEFYYKGILKHSYFLSVRRYTLTEFKSLLEETGFEFISVYGDFDGSPFSVSPPSKRMIVIAQKS